MRFFARCLTASLTSLLFFVVAHTVSAFSVSPAIIDQHLAPGATLEQTFTIKNDEAIDQTFYFTIQKFKPKNGSGQQEFLPPSDLNGLPRWISLDAPLLKLKAGETHQVRFRIDPPKDAEAGGHYAALFISNLPPVATVPNVAVGARTGILLFINVDGTVVREAKLSQFALEKHQGDIQFNVDLRNTGTSHIQPVGSIQVKNIFGQEVANLSLNPDGKRLLPRESRRLEVIWSKDERAWNAIGPLTATLRVTEPNALSASKSFVCVPWIALGIVAVMIVLLVVLTRKKRWE